MPALATVNLRTGGALVLHLTERKHLPAPWMTDDTSCLTWHWEPGFDPKHEDTAGEQPAPYPLLVSCGFTCPASSSWQRFFDLEVADGGVGEASVDLVRPVPGDGLVRTDVVVVLPVRLHILDELESVVDLLTEQSLVLHRPKPALA